MHTANRHQNTVQIKAHCTHKKSLTHSTNQSTEMVTSLLTMAVLAKQLRGARNVVRRGQLFGVAAN